MSTKPEQVRGTVEASVVWRRKPCPVCGGKMQLQHGVTEKYWSCSELIENPFNPRGSLIACGGWAEYGKPDNTPTREPGFRNTEEKQ